MPLDPKLTEPIRMPDGRPLRVLIIDDDSFIAGVYIISLERHAVEVLYAADGENGLKIAAEKSPDIVLLDVMMPGLDGFETLKRLKDDPKTKGIPVLMLTSLSQKEDVERSTVLGAVGYLKKTQTLPVDAQDKIKEVLNLA